jgi:hypothetical protein
MTERKTRWVDVRCASESGREADMSGRRKCATTGLMHRSQFHPYSITLSVRANEQRPRPAFEGIVDTLPALQDLAPIWRSLLAVTSDVTHITII